MLKQNTSSPISLCKGIGILSLANQDLIHHLEEGDVRVFLQMYYDLPSWVQLFIPARLIGKAILLFGFSIVQVILRIVGA